MNTSLVCVDASVVTDVLFGLDEDPRLQTRWAEWVEQGMQLVAPRLLRYEVTNAIFQIAKKSQVSPESAEETVRLLTQLPIQLMDDDGLHNRAFQIARDLSLSATYDAHYLALAYALDCEFWTRDAKLVRAAQQQYRWVRLLDQSDR